MIRKSALLMGLVLAGVPLVRGVAVGRAAAPEPDGAGLCAKHRIPTDRCAFCEPSLVERLGWCAGHGVPEAFCTRCSPEIIPAFKIEKDWCAEHGLPESQCAICNPALAEKAAAAERDAAVAAEAPRIERPPSVRCATETLRVRFTSAAVARDAGLEFVEVQRRPVTQSLTCTAEVTYDGNRYARIGSRVSGVVREVRVDLGDAVRAGDVLAVIDSADLALARAAYLQAAALVTLWEKNHAREHALLERGIATERDDLEAENKLEESRVALSRATHVLRTLGLTGEQIAALARGGDADPLLPVTAPFDGLVVERAAVIGEAAEPTRPLFAVADTSRMWALIDVLEPDVGRVQTGQSVLLNFDALPGETFAGTITWLSTRIDPQTRTLRARAELENPAGLLRANMFGRADVVIHDREPLVVVPREAVQWEGCCNVVFARLSETEFAPRKVRLGCRAGDFVEVVEGVKPGETIVAQGSFLLKTEILKGSIGAGCCEAGAPQ